MDNDKLCGALQTDIDRIKRLASFSADVSVDRISAGGTDCAILSCEGMLNRQTSYEAVVKPLYEIKRIHARNGKALARRIKSKKLLYGAAATESVSEALAKAIEGNAVLLIDGTREAFCVPQQGYSVRAIAESYTEENVRSGREGFSEPLRVNITLIRRRLKAPTLKFEYMSAGSESETQIALVYMTDKADNGLVAAVREKLKSTDLRAVLESGFLQPFLNEEHYNLFSTVGYTERPDILCAKLIEGRVGVMVDGTPFVLTVPHLFIENFQCFDDYSQKALYASFLRIVKLAAFAIGLLLPGVYVAVAMHSPELLPVEMLKILLKAENGVAISLLAEALFIQLVYEIVREAGLRLPRPVGHAVSLIGALVVGETAILAGFAGAPMVMIGAFTAICSFTVPKLYRETAILRFAYIILGGILGLAGILFGVFFLVINISAANSFGTPYLAPIVPKTKASPRDTFIRRSWRRLSKEDFVVSDLSRGQVDE